MRKKTKKAVQKSPTLKILKRSFSPAVSSVSFSCANEVQQFCCCFSHAASCVPWYIIFLMNILYFLFCFWLNPFPFFHSVHAARTPPKSIEPFPAPLDHSFSESVLEKPGPAVKIVTPVIDRVGFSTS